MPPYRARCLVYTVLVSIMALVLIGIAASQQSWAQERFRIGAVLPLTGPAADYGIAIKNCIELAQRDKPELFSNIDFIYEDAAYDPKNAVSAFKKLTDFQRVNLTVTWGVSFCKALAPIAEAKKVPLVGICLDPTMAGGKRYVFRFKNTTDEIMRAQSEYLFTQGKRKIGLLLAEHPYLEEITDALRRNLVEGQTLAIIDQLPNNEMDFRTNILRIMKRSGEFDSVGVFLFAGQIATFYKQARDMGLATHTFGSDFFESVSEVRASNGAMNGVTFTSIDIKDTFLNRYKDIFKSESQLAFGAPAYEFATTVGELLNNRERKPSKDELIDMFASVPPRDGVASGPYRYVHDPVAGQYFQFPVVVKRVVGETFETVR